jgi:alpha-galactosidase/6-phospho-beta-glucosidase family protein
MTAPFKVAIIGAGSVGFTRTLISDLLYPLLDPRIRASGDAHG